MWWTGECGQQFPLVFKESEIVDDVRRHKKAMATGECSARLLPQFTQLIADSMESKGDQIQCQQQIGQSLVSVPEVLLGVINVVFQQVEAFVFDLPAGSATRYDCGFHETFSDCLEMKATVPRTRQKPPCGCQRRKIACWHRCGGLVSVETAPRKWSSSELTMSFMVGVYIRFGFRVQVFIINYLHVIQTMVYVKFLQNENCC